MRLNKTKKFTVVLLALLFVVSMALSACDGAGKFEYPDKPTGSGVTSNGGMAVSYGDYLYFVNGYQSDAKATNKYTGQVKNGDIVRIKLSDLPALFEYYDNHHEDDNYSTQLSELVFAKADVVVPMFYYSANTTSKTINGLFIFGEKLYFTTPNPELYASGAAKNDQLSIFSCDLDGRNLKNLYSIPSISATVALMESGSSVYAVYVDGDTKLCYVDLSKNRPEEQEIAKATSSVSFDLQTNKVFFIDNAEFLDDDGTQKNENYKSILTYTLGDSAPSALVKNPDNVNESYSITQTNTVDGVGYVYYTITNSTDKTFEKQGLWMVSTQSAPKRLIESTTNFTSFRGYKDQIIVAGSRANTTPATVQLYIVKNGNTAVVDYIIPINTNSETITINSIVGSTLNYTVSNKTYTVDLSKNITGTAGAERKEVYTSISTAGWAEIDQVVVNGQTYYFGIGSASATVYRYAKNDDGDLTLTSVVITVVQPVEEE